MGPCVADARELRMMLWGLNLALGFAEGPQGLADLMEVSRLRGPDRCNLLDFLHYQGGFTVGKNRGQHAAYDDVFHRSNVAKVLTAKQRRAAKVGPRPGKRARKKMQAQGLRPR